MQKKLEKYNNSTYYQVRFTPFTNFSQKTLINLFINNMYTGFHYNRLVSSFNIIKII